MELTEKTGRLSVSVTVRDGDEIISISSKGRMIRMPVEGITVMKRHSVGNIIVRLDDGDSVADCSVIKANDDEDMTAVLPFEADEENENS